MQEKRDNTFYNQRETTAHSLFSINIIIMEGKSTNAFTTFDPLIPLLEIYPKDKFAIVLYTCYILNHAIIYLDNKIIHCTIICET